MQGLIEGAVFGVFTPWLPAAPCDSFTTADSVMATPTPDGAGSPTAPA